MTRPVGRPTKYDPRYCDEIIAYMKQGYSKTAFAGHILVSRDTIREWADVHPEFSAAVKIAEAARVSKLELDLLSESQGPRVTSRIFALKNACPDEWKEDVNLKHGGDKKNPIKLESVLITGIMAKAAETV